MTSARSALKTFVVIGCDQLAVLDKTVLEKFDVLEVCAFLGAFRMSGQTTIKQ